MKLLTERLFSLRGTTGIVTGGLGLEIANVLVALGAHVHAFSRSGRAKSGARSRKLRHHAVDITDEDQVTDALREIGRGRAIATLSLQRINEVVALVGGILGIAYLLWKWRREASKRR